MKTGTTIFLSATVMAAVLLTSGFGFSPAHAQTSNTTAILSKIPSSLNNHTVVFQVCAQAVTMRAPEVILSSDSEVKNIRLNKEISPNTCRVTAGTIHALDADTIKIKKIDKSKINTMIDAAEKRLSKIKAKISDKNIELEEFLATIPGNTPTKPANIKKLNDIGYELTEMRKELADARSEYYRLLYVLKG